MTLSIGDTVRVKTTTPPTVGRITRISTGEKLKRWPYLVSVPGHGEMSLGIADLEKLPDRAFAPMLPPAIVPMRAIRGASGKLVCGTTNCFRILDPAEPTCPKCGAAWVL